MPDFKKLKVWQQSHAMAIEAHRVATRMRGAAHSSLRNQLVRAAMSIPTNIVEGRGQKTEPEFSRFLGYSIASLSELEYHLIIARDIKAIDDTDFLSLVSQIKVIRPMLHAFQKKLQPAASSQKRR